MQGSRRREGKLVLGDETSVTTCECDARNTAILFYYTRIVATSLAYKQAVDTATEDLQSVTNTRSKQQTNISVQ